MWSAKMWSQDIQKNSPNSTNTGKKHCDMGLNLQMFNLDCDRFYKMSYG